ncbi:uncharacterized protein [Rutidosis leptorrhynchoides]|uniref:uncharacterized protein isoform X2 n=1 Tax=Rutidosis leptorrhynchoides TaxID=125765 RepID=UPI003A9A5D18
MVLEPGKQTGPKDKSFCIVFSYYFFFFYQSMNALMLVNPEPITSKLKVNNDVKRRRSALTTVDRQIAKGNYKLAVSLLKQLQRQPPPTALLGFASAKQASVIDEDGDLYLEDDKIEHEQVLQHEAGHFLVGYLLGVLPKQYKFSSIEDVNQDETIDASVKFVGFDFLTELDDVVLLKKNLDEVKPGHRTNKQKLSSTVLGKFACVVVGGLVTEHLVYGYSKGHHSDVEKLDRVVRWLQLPEDEANKLIRWAVLNTLVILRRHDEARSMLVEAMAHGRSIGYCIDAIESSLNRQDI